MSNRRLSPLDRLISGADQVLRTLSGTATQGERESPALNIPEAELPPAQRRHAAGLMRVNHAGEVCAQALYQGQALTAKLPGVRAAMELAAAEEADHLAWCEERLGQLDSRASFLNPLWYGLSFTLGAAAGLIGDRISLGFVAATEEQVCHHLRSHLQRLPPEDDRSRAILEQMLEDEQRHGETALNSGGQNFPRPLKHAMTAASRLMTHSSYYV